MATASRVTYRFVARDRQRLRATAAAIAELPIDQPLDIRVMPLKSKRSTDANAYYWGVLVSSIRQHLLDHQGMGISLDDLHEYLLERFAPTVERFRPDNKIRICTMRSSEMSVAEFAAYCQAVEAYAVDSLGIQLPADINAVAWVESNQA